MWRIHCYFSILPYASPHCQAQPALYLLPACSNLLSSHPACWLSCVHVHVCQAFSCGLDQRAFPCHLADAKRSFQAQVPQDDPLASPICTVPLPESYLPPPLLLPHPRLLSIYFVQALFQGFLSTQETKPLPSWN